MMKWNIGLFIILITTWVTLFFVDPSARIFIPVFLEKEFHLQSQAQWSIKLNHKQLRKLKENEERAKETGFLIKAAKRWSKGELFDQGKAYPVKVRLRGDLPKHWAGPKKSYRLKFQKDSPWKGYRVIDLILPEDKGDETEVAVYKIARKLDLLAPDAGFTTLAINHVSQGSYLWKQSYASDYFELQRRPESVVFRENNIWWFAVTAKGPYKDLFKPENNDTELHLEPHLYGTVYEGPTYNPQSFARFSKFLSTLKNQNPELETYLDQDRFYTWLALMASFGSVHAVLPDNVSWYLNTSTGLIEPVIFDVIPKKIYTLSEISNKSIIIKKILQMTWDQGGKEKFFKVFPQIERYLDEAINQAANERNASAITVNDSPSIAIYKRAEVLKRLVRENMKTLKSEFSW